MTERHDSRDPSRLGPGVAGRGARGHLGLVDDEGRPRVLPVTFVVAEGAAWTAVDHKPKSVPGERLARLRWLEARPESSLTVDRYDDDWSRLAWVQLVGRTDVLDVAGASGDRLRAGRPLPAVPRAPAGRPTAAAHPRTGAVLERARPIVIGRRRWPRCGFSTRRRRARARRWCRSRRCCASPSPKPLRPPAPERSPRPEPEPEPAPPPRFRVVEVLSRRVLSDDASTRETIGVLEGVRSVVDVSIYRWAERRPANGGPSPRARRRRCGGSAGACRAIRVPAVALDLSDPASINTSSLEFWERSEEERDEAFARAPPRRPGHGHASARARAGGDRRRRTPPATGRSSAMRTSRRSRATRRPTPRRPACWPTTPRSRSARPRSPSSAWTPRGTRSCAASCPRRSPRGRSRGSRRASAGTRSRSWPRRRPPAAATS